MKTKLLLILVLITQITLAQQVTLMQPALRDSDKVLVRVETFSTIDGYDNEFFSGYTNYTSYDTEKNPTTYNGESYDENGNIIDIYIDGYETSEYYPIDEFVSDYFYSAIFPIKSSYRKTLNTNTNELLELFHYSLIKDARFSIYNRGLLESYWDFLEYYSYKYDDSFNLIAGDKNEVTMQGDYPIEKLFYVFNNTTNTFEPNYKEVYYSTFDNGVLTERITKRITDFTTNIEVNYSKETFIINTDSFENHLFIWYDTTNTWEFLKKRIITYNIDNVPLDIIIWVWDSTSGWTESESTIFTYNDLGLCETMSLYDGYFTYNYTYNFDNLLTEYQVRVNGGTPETQSITRFVLFYAPVTASTNETNTSIINIYPNPTNKILNIDLEENFEYQIYSIQGKLLKESISNKQIQVSDLEKGIYFIHIKTANLEEKQKFVVN